MWLGRRPQQAVQASKDAIKRVPLLGSLAVQMNFAARRKIRGWTFKGSAALWESHYSKGGTSGAGSYGELAAFKAEVINEFVARHDVQSVIEFGCGDGNQLALGRYPRYVGLDISRSAVMICRDRFVNDPTKSFFLYDPQCFVDRNDVFGSDVALSLDVIFHLVEDESFDLYMRHLFAAARRFVLVYSSDVDERGYDPGLRHRRWSSWVESYAQDWTVSERVANRHPFQGDANNGSHSDLFVCRRREMPAVALAAGRSAS